MFSLASKKSSARTVSDALTIPMGRAVLDIRRDIHSLTDFKKNTILSNGNRGSSMPVRPRSQTRRETCLYYAMILSRACLGVGITVLAMSWYTGRFGRRPASSRNRASALWLIGLGLVGFALMLVAAGG
jgi:hypothetical protein